VCLALIPQEGHYLLNFKACAQCGHRASLSTSNRYAGNLVFVSIVTDSDMNVAGNIRVHKEIDDDATDADEQEETISFERTS